MLFVHFSVSVYPELSLLILLLITRNCLKEAGFTVCLCLSFPVRLCVSEKLGVLFVHFSVSVYPELILLILLLVTRSCLKEAAASPRLRRRLRGDGETIQHLLNFVWTHWQDQLDVRTLTFTA